MVALAGQLVAHSDAKKVWEASGADMREQLRGPLEELGSCLRRVNAETFRLSMRIGDSHDAIRSLADVYAATKAQRDIIENEEPSEDSRARHYERGAVVEVALVAFRNAAVEEIQVRRDAL